MNGPGALPGWFWLLPLAAILLWWPIDPFWASDDFIALHYAESFAAASRDLWGWQYGSTDLWFFWRPLITLSFWLDRCLGGGDPFVAHLSNVLAHGACALLVGLLWRRLLRDPLAFAAGLLWAIAPGHAGTIGWAVGRVDGHTTVWCLLCLWSFVRWCEGARGARWLSWLALALALMSKELALTLPLLCTLLAALQTPTLDSTRAQRLRATWPHWGLLALYLLFRLGWLGRLGGYRETVIAPAAMASGWLSFVLDLLNPWRWADAASLRDALGDASGWLVWPGWVPGLTALAFCLWPGSRRPAAALLLLFAVACAPIAGFFASADNHHNLRYFYLPWAALAGLLVAPGRVAAALALVCFLPAFALARQEQWRADTESRAMHQQLLQQLPLGHKSPWFVAGLPHANAAGTVVQLHFGIDRMLLPPFGPGGVRLFAHRPLVEAPDVFRLLDHEGLPLAAPAGTTLLLNGRELLMSMPERPLPALPLVAEWRGRDAGGQHDAVPWIAATDRLDLSSARMQQLKNGSDKAATDAIEARLRMPGVRAALYRVTIFTATGYLCAAVPDHGAVATADGTIDLRLYFEKATCNAAGTAFVLRLLEVPTTVDLEPSFPVLVEAGAVRDGQFVATHRARSMPLLRFDRGYPAVVRRMLAIDK